MKKQKKILRGALKEYPNSYRLMSMLAMTLENIAYQTKAETVKKALNEEVISLGEKILAECTDDKLRSNAILFLCHTYCDTGENEKAMDLANKMPGKSSSSDSLLRYILKGTEKFRHKQKEIANDMIYILEEITNLYLIPLDGEEMAKHKDDEFAALDGKVIDIINILCEDGNFGSFSHKLSRAHLSLCDFNIRKKDNDAALKHFRLAAQFAIFFDAKCRFADDTAEEYTSLLFGGMKFGNTKYIEPHSRSQDLLKKIESENYYSYFPSAELDAIKEELQKYANPAV